MEDGALISSETLSYGDGGNIELVLNQVTLSGGSSIAATSTFTPNAGKAGDISMTAHNTFQSDYSSVTTATNETEGGDISIMAGQDVLLRNESLVSAESFGAGNAGNISITAHSTFQSDNSTGIRLRSRLRVVISASRAGQDVLLRNESLVSAESFGAGNAGNISIRAVIHT